jgi:hypothetical protein
MGRATSLVAGEEVSGRHAGAANPHLADDRSRSRLAYPERRGVREPLRSMEVDGVLNPYSSDDRLLESAP